MCFDTLSEEDAKKIKAYAKKLVETHDIESDSDRSIIVDRVINRYSGEAKYLCFITVGVYAERKRAASRGSSDGSDAGVSKQTEKTDGNL